MYKLFRAGASDIVRETFDSSLRASRYMLQAMDWSEYDAEKASEAFFKADRHALQELAELWDPAVPNVQNDAYVQRAKSINKELYTGFLANLSALVDADNDTPKPRDAAE
ncbi:MAG: hypothetical protein AAF631_09660 [Pseudomonadota bacterium]